MNAGRFRPTISLKRSQSSRSVRLREAKSNRSLRVIRDFGTLVVFSTPRFHLGPDMWLNLFFADREWLCPFPGHVATSPTKPILQHFVGYCRWQTGTQRRVPRELLRRRRQWWQRRVLDAATSP